MAILSLAEFPSILVGIVINPEVVSVTAPPELNTSSSSSNEPF